jgi:hypothetical protein
MQGLTVLGGGGVINHFESVLFGGTAGWIPQKKSAPNDGDNSLWMLKIEEHLPSAVMGVC